MNTNDITAFVLFALGLAIFILNVRTAICWQRNKFVTYWYAISGLVLSVSFGLSIIDDLTGGTGIVAPEIGRPTVIILAGSVLIASILRYRSGRC